MPKKKSPELMDVDDKRIEEMLQRAAGNELRTEDAELIQALVESYGHITSLIQDKNISLRRLRRLLFGAKTENARSLLGEDTSPDERASNEKCPSTSQSPGDPAEIEQSTADDEASQPGEKTPGHGRYSADVYQGASTQTIPHSRLQPGDPCPECEQGTVYQKEPKKIVRFIGQAPLGATVYKLQRLRCHLCGTLFTATLPEEAGDKKYDATSASMIAILKYGSGFPFNRLERLQGNCHVPLAASTQWDIVKAAYGLLQSAYKELIRQAAQGDVIHNDDTTVRILELMGERYRNNPPEDSEHHPKRTGMFTSGVVAVRADVRIALFFSGRKVAGENLQDVLRERAADLDSPIQMCDGLSQNLPKEFETIVANCLVHARRKFVDIYEEFPEACQHLIEQLGLVYHYDEKTRDEEMTDQERLVYHQTHSRPIMEQLRRWLEAQLEGKEAEPNSSLGAAIQYMLKRWGRLTLFLHKPGAPLDNNSAERALKKAILHRKNSMFYRSREGSRVGDLFMSLIYTCELAKANAHDYLTQLQQNAEEVKSNPGRWMPWNYQENKQPAAAAA